MCKLSVAMRSIVEGCAQLVMIPIIIAVLYAKLIYIASYVLETMVSTFAIKQNEALTLSCRLLDPTQL